jgi:acetyl-CoA acetyltransferase
VNVSGGLLSEGHPLGATGVANIYEVSTHLRGEAGDRQVEGAKVGLTHVIGLGSACGIHILEKV